MLLDLRIDQLAEMRPETLVRPLFVRPHQPRIARHIGGEDCGETGFDRLFHGLPGRAIIAETRGSERRNIPDSRSTTVPSGWEAAGLPLCYMPARPGISKKDAPRGGPDEAANPEWPATAARADKVTE
jgi:hypothetical protein